MHRIHIPGFPNHMSGVNWHTFLPRFKDQERDDDVIHLTRFHMHVCNLKVVFHEDCLMKMFMESLEGNAQSWYERLPNDCLYSLRDFRTIFYERYKEHHPSLLLVKYCCTHFDNFIEDFESFYKDDQFMDDEIIEAIHESPFNHQEEELQTSCHHIRENFQQIVPFLLPENEVNQYPHA